MLHCRALYLTFALAAFAGGVVASAAPSQAGPPRPGIAAPRASLAIIVNTQNPVDALSLDDLRRMLLGEVTRWPDGRKITIAMRDAGQPERDAVLRLVCRMSDQDFTRYLLQATFRGELQSAPKVLDTPTGVRRFVFNVPGAIGYVRGDEVDGSVKVLKITGAVPDDPAFGLTLQAK